jgi:hypothetical protein
MTGLESAAKRARDRVVSTEATLLHGDEEGIALDVDLVGPFELSLDGYR